MNLTETASPSAWPGRPGLTLRVHLAEGPPAQAHIGLASLELAVPIGEDTVFNVGSVAKQIIAYLLIRAARDGLLTLDRPVGDILPRFRIPDVSVADLIGHYGGIRDAESLLSLAGFRDLDHYTAEDLMELAYRQDRRAVPPGRFLYSNTGYLLLADVLRHVHGAAIAEIADQVLLTPLGMTSARFKSDPRQVIPGAATSYGPTDTGWRHHQRPVTLPGPGSLWCTTADLDRWLRHLSREWRRTAGRALPFDEHVGYRPSDHQPFTYGAGLYADLRTTDAAVFHYGHEQGFSAAARLSRSGLAVVCLSNHAAIPADRVAASALTELARHPGTDPHCLLAQAAGSSPAPKAAVPEHGSDLADAPHTVLGTYSCPQVPGTVRLSRSGDTLYLWRRGTGDRLTRTGAARYAASGYTLTLPTDPLDDGARLDGFVLDLDRAPHLHYWRQPDDPVPPPAHRHAR